MTWLIPVTTAGLEKRVADRLRDSGFEVWFPTRLVQYKSRHMRTIAERAYPTFPGYLFARPSGSRPVYRHVRPNRFGPIEREHLGDEPHHAWRRDALDVEDVRAILGSVSHAEVDRVRGYLDDLATTPVDIAIWRKNDVARVVDGPFASFDAVVEAGERGGRVRAAIEMFGRLNSIEFDATQLRRVA